MDNPSSERNIMIKVLIYIPHIIPAMYLETLFIKIKVKHPRLRGLPCLPRQSPSTISGHRCGHQWLESMDLISVS
jgi:hypothetical protein